MKCPQKVRHFWGHFLWIKELNTVSDIKGFLVEVI